MNSEDISPDDETQMEPTESDASPIVPDSPATPTENSTLPQMVATAQAGRMSPAHETQTADLLRSALLGGKPEINEALDAIGKLPWPISVNGLNAAWPEMKPYGRRLFVSGMKGPAFEGEIGRRIRLSITRGLVKVDEAQAAKWACAIAAEMLGEDGILTTRDRQSFFNVLVGKGKPWLLRLQLDGLKDADLAHLLNAAISTIFTGGCPPFTQSAFLLWLIKIDKLTILSERSQQSIAQAIRKWPGRLMRDFKTVPENLPTAIAEAFAEKTSRRNPADAPENTETPADETAEPAAESDSDDDDEEDDDYDEEDDDEKDDDEDEASGERRESRPKHPPYVSPGQPNRPSNQPAQSSGRDSRGGRGGERTQADPVAMLRQLDNFIRQQSQELSQARTKLRQLEERGGGGGRDKRGRGRGGRYGSGGGDGVWPDTTPPEDNESLRRYVAQLESINSELRTRLEDLAQDGERRAQSMVSPEGTPLGEREQLINFLSLKLGKDHADYLKLSREPDDEVFREHYRIVAENVFDILAAEGIHPKPPEVPQVDLG
ncbi:MAG: hypothetical protein ABIT76_01525 [Chthoniobacterales bacterium]